MKLGTKTSLILIVAIFLSACGGESGSGPSSVGVVNAPSPTSTSSGGSTGATPAPVPTVYYQRFTDAPAGQAYDLVCLAGIEKYFEDAAGGLKYNRFNGDVSYALPYFGTKAFAAADRVETTEAMIRYRQPEGDGRSFLTLHTGFGAVEANYVRAVEIGRVAGSGYSTGVSCVAGVGTLVADIPRAAMSRTFTRVYGGASSSSNGTWTFYRFTSVAGTALIDPIAKTIQVEVVLSGNRDGAGDAAELGRFSFRTSYAGEGNRFFGDIYDNNGTSGRVAAAFFGPSAQEVGIVFSLVRKDASGSNSHFYGQLIAAR